MDGRGEPLGTPPPARNATFALTTHPNLPLHASTHTLATPFCREEEIRIEKSLARCKSCKTELWIAHDDGMVLSTFSGLLRKASLF